MDCSTPMSALPPEREPHNPHRPQGRCGRLFFSYHSKNVIKPAELLCDFISRGRLVLGKGLVVEHHPCREQVSAWSGAVGLRIPLPDGSHRWLRPGLLGSVIQRLRTGRRGTGRPPSSDSLCLSHAWCRLNASRVNQEVLPVRLNRAASHWAQAMKKPVTEVNHCVSAPPASHAQP